MRLPLYELAVDGQSNRNPEGPTITIKGSGMTEQTPESLLSNFPIFRINDRLLYSTEEVVTDTWTFEMSAPVRANGVLLSTTGYTDGSGYYIRLNNGYFTLVGITSGITRLMRNYIIPRDVTGKVVDVKHVALVNVNDIVKCYVNYELAVEIDIPVQYRKGNVNLLGYERGSIYNYNGDIEYVGFTPRVTLPPEMFYRPNLDRDKSLDNSFFVDEPYDISDTTIRAVRNVRSFLDHVLVSYSNGELVSYSRPQGTGEGNVITDVSVDESKNVTFTLDSGETIEVGNSGEMIVKESGTVLEGGSGYKVGNRLLDIQVSGNALSLNTHGQVTIAEISESNPDLNTCVVLTSQSTAATKYVYGTDGFSVQRYSVLQYGDDMGYLSADRYVLEPGAYYVEGTYAVSSGEDAKIVLRDPDGNVLLDFGVISTGTTALNKFSNCILTGTFSISKDTPIDIAERARVNLYSSYDDPRCFLKIYKVK